MTGKVLKSTLSWLLYMLDKAIPGHTISVLMYHSISRNNITHAITPEEFDREIDYLKQKFDIVSLDEIINLVNGERVLSHSTAAITFDDGYLDNHSNAYPVLLKYKVPATIFVSTGNFNGEMILSGIKIKMLAMEEIKEMSKNGVTIGAHTVTHPKLTDLAIEQAKEEILKSKDKLEELTEKKIDYFAYPKGKYNDQIVELVKSSGFKAAFAGEGLIRRGDNPFTLRRIQIDSSVNFTVFKAKLTKTLDILRRKTWMLWK